MEVVFQSLIGRLKTDCKIKKIDLEKENFNPL